MVCKTCGRDFFEDWRKDPRGSPRFCSRACSNKRKHSKETKKKIKKGVIKYFKENNKNREVKYCKSCGVSLSFNNNSGYCKKHYQNTAYFRNKISNALKKSSKVGGYREGSGSRLNGIYKGYRCDSTWELAYIIYLLDNDISFKRNTDKYKYINKKGEERYYIPDFILEDETIVEVKGPKDVNWENKLKHFPYKNKLIILTKKDIYPIIKQVKEKYKVSRIEYLYDSIENKQCKVCEKILSKRNISGYCRNHVYLIR